MLRVRDSELVVLVDRGVVLVVVSIVLLLGLYYAANLLGLLSKCLK